MKAPEQRETFPQKAGRITAHATGIRRRTVAALTISACLLDPALAVAAMPADPAEDIFADLAPLAAESLDRMRGGFRVGNLDINVGVTVTTSITGLVDVTSNFSINAPGDLRNLGSEIKATTQKAAAEARDAANAARDAAEQAIGTANAQAAAAMAAAREKLEATMNGVKPAAPTAPETPTAPEPPATPAPPAPSAPNPVVVPGEGANIDVAQPTVVTDPSGVVSHVVSISRTPDADDAPVPVSPETVAEIIHRISPDGGHTSIITNRLDNISITQNVSVDLSVDNFSAMQVASGIRQAITGIVHQIGVLSLRR